MSRPKTAGLFLSALAAVALAAGCGGGDAKPSPKEAYIAKADQICALGTFHIGSEARKRYGTPQPPPGRAREYGRRIVVPVLQQEVLKDLRALPRPAGDEQRLAAIYDSLEAGIAALRSNPKLFAKPDVGGVLDQTNRLAQEYGFTQCGSG